MGLTKFNSPHGKKNVNAQHQTLGKRFACQGKKRKKIRPPSPS